MTNSFRQTPGGQLEIQHPGTGGYVPAIALLPDPDGLPIALIPDQKANLDQIVQQVQLLNQLSERLSVIQQKLNSINLSDVSTPVTQTHPKLDNLAALLTSLNQVVTTISTTSTDIASRTINYTTQLANILEAVDQVNSSVGTGNTTAGTISTRVDSIRTTQEAIQTLITTLSNLVTSNNTLVTSVRDELRSRPAVALNSGAAILNAVSVATSSSAITVSNLAGDLLFQPFFSANTASCSILVEQRMITDPLATNVADRIYSEFSFLASTFTAATNTFPATASLVIPALGCVQVVLHLRSISTGNVTVFGREIQ